MPAGPGVAPERELHRATRNLRQGSSVTAFGVADPLGGTLSALLHLEALGLAGEGVAVDPEIARCLAGLSVGTLQRLAHHRAIHLIHHHPVEVRHPSAVKLIEKGAET